MKLMIVALLLLSAAGAQAQEPAAAAAPPAAGQEHEHVEECGSPLTESMAWATLSGQVIQVTGGRSFLLRSSQGRTVQVDLAALDAGADQGAARVLLASLVLGRDVTVLAPQGKPGAPTEERVAGTVLTGAGNAKDVNRELLQAGVARFQEPPAYSVSSYSTCLYRIAEREAKQAGRGIWKSPQAAPAPAPPRSLYDRIADKLATRDDLATLDQPPAQLAEVRWMIGTWDVEVTVFATAASPQSVERGTSQITPALNGYWLQLADTYPAGTQDLSFLTYNRVTREWVSLGLDSFGNSVLAKGAAWDGTRLVLTAADVEVLGEIVTLRQTMEKRGADELVLLNEEKLPNGTWLPLDQYRYRRRPAG